MRSSESSSIMRKEVIVLMILIYSGFAIAGPLDHSSGLISYWKADGNANDTVGSNHGTLVNGTYAAGKVGQAFYLDGINDYVVINDSPSLSLNNSFTLSAWAYLESVSRGSIFSKFDAVAGTRSYHLIIGQAGAPNTEPEFIVSPDGGIHTQYRLKSATNFPTGGWHHVVATHNSSHMKIYVDGTLDVSKTIVSGEVYDSTDPLFIGNARQGGLDYFLFDGAIDDVAIWNRVLDDTEILDLYNNPENSESGVIPEVGNRALQIFVVLIVVLLVGALLLRNK